MRSTTTISEKVAHVMGITIIGRGIATDDFGGFAGAALISS